ncbi:hypothetical protein Clacol_001998 [Clathrus columnatus]|uniref:GH16 domain-containing protein n=1 Tax=Clathrus columnatus TaxID=1419009 RepID=A0AAV5A3K7_9AGAM|nr:hypothetical protein Clacol_001998 [Clathrus columnatus]
MLQKTFFALWFLSFLSNAYGFGSSTICFINGTFVIGDACSHQSSDSQVLIAKPSTDSATTHKTTTSASSSFASPTTVNNVAIKSSSSSAASESPFSVSPPASKQTSSSSSQISSSRTTSSSPPWATLPTIGNAPKPKGSSFELVTFYQGEDFVNNWDYFTASDPTHGNVHYVNQQDALSLGLVQVEKNVTTIKVDDTTQLSSGQNRNSVRISSKKRVTGGLVVANISAMPTGCSIWPAFWLVGDSWPSHGEVDIIEGVNRQTRNQITLHTLPGCTRNDNAKPAAGQSIAFSGTPLQVSCDVTVNSNSGCGIMSTQANSFGLGFNQNGGGVLAMMWDTMGIRVWSFLNGSVPDDLTQMNPTPSKWPIPDAYWSAATCPVDKYFANMMMVFDTTLCGDFAGALFPSSGCPGTCAETVADPTNFKNAKWIINSVAVYN